MAKVLMTLMGMEIGGAETHVLELSKTLHRMGHDVHVVSNGGVYVAELEEYGIKHYNVPLHNKQLINGFSSFTALWRIIRKNDIRLVHAHARIPAFICGILQKLLRLRGHRFKLVTTAHLDFSVKFPFNLLSKWGDRTMAVSGDIKDYLLANYKIEERVISLTINGVDTEKFSPEINAGDISEELGLRAGTRKIVSVSRLDKDRSLPARMLIEIAAECAEELNLEVILVGDGDDFEEISARAAEVNGLAARKIIYLTGARTDTNKFCALADVFVNVSRSALEAMSAGAPLILAGNQGYLGIFDKKTEAIATRTNFTCRNCGDLTREKLERDLRILLAMPEEERAALGAYGRGIIESGYSMERMARDAVMAYEDVLSPDFARKRSVNIMISGYYGYDNSGDDVLLQSIVTNLRACRGDLNLTVLSFKPKATRAQFKVGAVYRFNAFKIISRLRRADILITGGGNLIQDETSTKSLIYYLFIIKLAKFFGAKIMLYAKGIGPLSRPANIRRVQKALSDVEMITLRESGSLEVLAELGITKPQIHVTADAAFALPQEADNAGARPPYFCVALRSWQNNPPDIEEKVAWFADYLVETYGYEAVFVPMCPAQDSELLRRVLAKMKNPGTLFEPGDFSQSRAILGGARFAVCMRLHGLIFAMEKGVPAIGLVYSPKIQQFMETMRQPWFLPVEEIETDTLVRFSEEIHANKGEISREIFEHAGRLRKLAARNAELCMELI